MARRTFRCVICRVKCPARLVGGCSSPCPSCRKLMTALSALHRDPPPTPPRLLRPVRCYPKGQ